MLTKLLFCDRSFNILFELFSSSIEFCIEDSFSMASSAVQSPITILPKFWNVFSNSWKLLQDLKSFSLEVITNKTLLPYLFLNSQHTSFKNCIFFILSPNPKTISSNPSKIINILFLLPYVEVLEKPKCFFKPFSIKSFADLLILSVSKSIKLSINLNQNAEKAYISWCSKIVLTIKYVKYVLPDPYSPIKNTLFPSPNLWKSFSNTSSPSIVLSGIISCCGKYSFLNGYCSNCSGIVPCICSLSIIAKNSFFINSCFS